MRSAVDVAVLLAAILKRSGQKRARVSTSTLKLLGRRHRLRTAFLADVANALGDYGLSLVELDNGGYGLMEVKALEAAPAVTAKKWLTTEELESLRRGTLKITSFRKVAGADVAAPEEEG